MANAPQPSGVPDQPSPVPDCPHGAVPACPEEALFVELVRTTDLLSRGTARLLKAHALSPAQYNVLRILRGSPDGLICSEIGERMITRDPDVTRLLERLEKRGLVNRCREQADRRMVMARISAEGAELLGRLDEPVQELHRRQLGHLKAADQCRLLELLEAARSQVS